MMFRIVTPKMLEEEEGYGNSAFAGFRGDPQVPLPNPLHLGCGTCCKSKPVQIFDGRPPVRQAGLDGSETVVRICQAHLPPSYHRCITALTPTSMNRSRRAFWLVFDNLLMLAPPPTGFFFSSLLLSSLELSVFLLFFIILQPRVE